jgi:hypothetical protein
LIEEGIVLCVTFNQVGLPAEEGGKLMPGMTRIWGAAVGKTRSGDKKFLRRQKLCLDEVDFSREV